MNTSTTAYYIDQQQLPLLSTYVYFQFNFAAQYLTIVNDDVGGVNKVIVSFNGTRKDGQVNPGERWSMDDTDAPGVYLKYENAAPAYRVMARPE